MWRFLELIMLNARLQIEMNARTSVLCKWKMPVSAIGDCIISDTRSDVLFNLYFSPLYYDPLPFLLHSKWLLFSFLVESKTKDERREISHKTSPASPWKPRNLNETVQRHRYSIQTSCNAGVREEFYWNELSEKEFHFFIINGPFLDFTLRLMSFIIFLALVKIPFYCQNRRNARLLLLRFSGGVECWHHMFSFLRLFAALFRPGIE